jgi:hypothetical protein
MDNVHVMQLPHASQKLHHYRREGCFSLWSRVMSSLSNREKVTLGGKGRRDICVCIPTVHTMKKASIPKVHGIQKSSAANILPWHLRLCGMLANKIFVALANPRIRHLLYSNKPITLGIAHELHHSFVSCGII